MIIKDLGIIEYGTAWELQKEIFAQTQAGTEDTLLLCEHPHVYTLGKSGHIENLLIKSDLLKNIGATYYKTDRGGDITYHGPGQLVAYPIINLTNYHLGLREYINLLEEAVIRTIAKYNITGQRSSGATGVWINDQRKICAIGVKASRNVTMHGLALNVTTNLDYFRHINPCGFVDRSVTSIKQEAKLQDAANEILMTEVKEAFLKHFNELFVRKS